MKPKDTSIRPIQMTRRAAILGAGALALSRPSYADDYPSRPIKIIVGFAAGGTSDSITRLYAQKMSEILKVGVVVENKPGGNQVNAINTLTSSPPDGYTLFTGGGSAIVQNPALRKDLAYNPLKDFSLIALVATNPAVFFVNNDLPVKTLAEFVNYAKERPGKVNYGSAGVGTAGHLNIEVLMSLTGIKLVHVPYKADVDVIRETKNNNVQMGMMPTLNATNFIRAGDLRAIGVTTAKRLSYLPDAPGLVETNIPGLTDLEPHTFAMFVGPAGMPAPLIARLNEVFNSITRMPDVQSKLRDTYFAETVIMSPEEVRNFTTKEIEKWKRLGKDIVLPE